MLSGILSHTLDDKYTYIVIAFMYIYIEEMQHTCYVGAGTTESFYVSNINVEAWIMISL